MVSVISLLNFVSSSSSLRFFLNYSSSLLFSLGRVGLRSFFLPSLDFLGGIRSRYRGKGLVDLNV